MISVSDNDQKIIEFLIRSYASRFTIREIGTKLKISSAGAYKSLKKLEQADITKSEKLGTGLFYEINYSHPAALYLACFVLAQQAKDVGELKLHCRAVFKSGESLTIVTNQHDAELVKSIASKQFKEAKISMLSEDEFNNGIQAKDKHIVALMEEAGVIHGAEFIIRAIARRQR